MKVYTEQTAREGSERMARLLGAGWTAATVTARTVDADVHYPAATCGGVRVVQTWWAGMQRELREAV